MPFYFRRSVKFGPVRVNFSKSGIGASSGVRGARVSVGPRGTRIRVGRGGIYYQRYIRSAKPRRTKSGNSSSSSSTRDTPEPSALPDDVTADDSLAEINAAVHRTSLVKLTYIISPLAFFGFLLAGSAAVALIILLIAPVILIFAYRQDRVRRAIFLTYDLDSESVQHYTALKQGLRDLQSADRIWLIAGQEVTSDVRRHAGANSLVARRAVTVGRMVPPCIQLDLEVWGIDCGKQKLFFLPDRALLFQNNQYGGVRYDSLRTEMSLVQFREGEVVPRDAQIIGETWQYVNKNGTPDRRFKSNRRIPIAQYAQLQLKFGSNLGFEFEVSSVPAAQAFYSAVGQSRPGAFHDQSGATGSGNGTKRDSTKPPAPPADERTKACEVLGVRPGSSKDEISAAYRHMASLYHPDKVAMLGPELQELAERRMREINAAYEMLNA